MINYGYFHKSCEFKHTKVFLKPSKLFVFELFKPCLEDLHTSSLDLVCVQKPT